VGALQEIFARFGFSYDKKGLTDAENATKRTTGRIGAAVASASGGIGAAVAQFAGFGAVLAGIGVVHFTNQLSEQLGAIEDLSVQLGLASDQLQFMGYAARVNGSSVEEMNASLSKLQIALGAAASGGKEQIATFAALNVRYQNADKSTRSLNEVLPEILENFANISDEGKQAAYAQDIFGRAGTKMLPFLRQGKEGVAKLRAEFNELGGGATAEATASASEYRNELARLDVAMFGLKSRIASAVFPQLNKLVAGASKAVANFGAWAKNTTLVDSAVLGLAGTVTLKLGGALAPYLGAGLKFAGIFLAVDDLIGFLEGKDSLIGDLLNRAFGAGTADKVRAGLGQLKAAWAETWRKMQEDPDGVIGHLAKPETWAPIVDAMIAAFKDAGGAIVRGAFGNPRNTAPVKQADLAGGSGGESHGFLHFVGKITGLDAARKRNTDAINDQAHAALDARAKRLGLQTSVEANHAGGGGIAAKDRTSSTSAEIGSQVTDNFARSLTELVSATKAFKGEGVDIRSVAPLRANAVTNYVEVHAPTTVTVPPGTPAQQAKDVGKAAERGTNRAAVAALERTR
jgi:hypothetical protein